MSELDVTTQGVPEWHPGRICKHVSFFIEIKREGVRWLSLPPNDMSRVVFVINDSEGAWDDPSGFSTRFDVSGVTDSEDEWDKRVEI